MPRNDSSPHYPTGIQLFLRAAKGRAYPRVMGMNRELSWWILDIIVPMLNMAAFAYLYRALHAPEQYIGFVILGAIISTFWVNIVWTMGSQLYWDKRSGFLELYVVSPVSLVAILFGMAIGGLYQSILRASVMAIFSSLLFDFHVSPEHWQLAVMAFVISLIAIYGLGMALATVFLLWGREAWQIALLLQEPAFFLTGLTFPLKKLFATVPGIITLLSAAIPMSFGLDALRQLLFPGQIEGVFTPGMEILILGGMSIVFLAIASFLVRYMEKLAKEGATLSLRWQ